MTENPRTLQTVEQTCAVLGVLREYGLVGVTELSKELGISKGAAYNHLATLRQEEFVVKRDKKYALSYKFSTYGQFLKHQSPLYTVGRPEIEKLSDVTGESAHIMVPQFGKGVYLHRAPGEKGIAEEFHQNFLQKTDYLHWSSTGKAILADLPTEKVEHIIDKHGLPSSTDRTIVNEEELFADLDRIREQGYAQNDQEQIVGVRAVGATVHDPRGKVLGAISVSGPTSRIDDERFSGSLPEEVLHTANVIEVNIQTKSASKK